MSNFKLKLKDLKKIVTFSSFICLLTLNFYKMQFQVLYFTFICYQLILVIEPVPKMNYLCFDLMFLNKINQVILVATLLFQCYKWSPSWRFTFSISYLSSRWMLFSDKQSYNQVNWNYMAKSRYQLTFCEFSEQLLHFHLLSTLKH